jgi:hypothetical protein
VSSLARAERKIRRINAAQITDILLRSRLFWGVIDDRVCHGTDSSSGITYTSVMQSLRSGPFLSSTPLLDEWRLWHSTSSI